MNPMDAERTGRLLAEQQVWQAGDGQPPRPLGALAFAGMLLWHGAALAWLYWQRHTVAEPLLWLVLACLLLALPLQLYLRLSRWQAYVTRQTRLARCQHELARLGLADATPGQREYTHD